MQPAIFLDRDGTLIEDRGYIDDLKNLVIFNYTFDALSQLQKFFLLFIITNQSGISKGLISEKKVKKLNAELTGIFADKNIMINEIFYCPHSTRDNCRCKKPKPYFIYKIKEKYNIDLKKSYVIGDHPADLELSKNAGCRGIYLLTGHGKKHKNEIPSNSIICENLYKAAKFIEKELILLKNYNLISSGKNL